MSVLDKILFGLQVAVIGMAIVFVCLILIIGLIKLLSWILKDRKKKAQEVAEPAPTPVAAEPAVQDDQELIAVLTAAIAATTGGQTGLVIRSFRRVGASAWAKAGRNEQIYNKL